MSNSFSELNAKFEDIQNRIVNKRNSLNESNNSQESLLEQEFQINGLIKKYSKRLNEQRLRLLDHIEANRSTELARISEIQNQSIDVNILLSQLNDLRKKRSLKFESSLLLERVAIRKLIIVEHKFRTRFSSARQLPKYKYFLGLETYFNQINNSINLNESFLLAVNYPDSEIVKLLIEAGANFNARDTNGNTALAIAVRNGHLGVIQLLLDHDADINATTNNGNTVLIEESSYGHLETIKLLSDSGADINAKNNNGETALIEAAKQGRVKIASYLLEKGARIDARDKDGNTALMKASSKRHSAVVKLLSNRE
jgi:hypothetical protein